MPRSWRACVEGWVEPHAARKVTPDDFAWADVVVGVQKSHQKAAADVRPEVRVVVRRIQDPAFRPVTEWPALAADVAVAAKGVVAIIEAKA